MNMLQGETRKETVQLLSHCPLTYDMDLSDDIMSFEKLITYISRKSKIYTRVLKNS